jgi:two-component system, LytTR family, sensor kinase
MAMKPATYHAVLRAYAVSIGMWCGISLLTGWQYRIFDEQRHINSSFLDMLLLAGSRGFCYAMLTPPIFYLARRSIGEVQNRFRYILLYVFGAAPFMLLYAGIHWLILPPWDGYLQQYVPRSQHGPLELIHSGFADQITIYIAIVVAAHAYQYFEKVRQQDMERNEFQRALAASELQALKMQLQPHFLFNTLHGISTLIDTDQVGAKEMVVKLSTLLRRTLERSGSDLIPLSEELTFAREYLDLEKMRLGARLAIDWSVDPRTLQTLVPQLILQPLIENAVRHGIACARDGGWLEISARRHRDLLELRVRNSIGGKRNSGIGVGLKNTEARLRNLYSDEAKFSFVESDDQIAVSTILLPALGLGTELSSEFKRNSEPAMEVDSHARAGSR